MEKIIYRFINIIYMRHSRILTLNDAYEYNFTDKELHFIVIGIIGMVMVFTVYPIFKRIAKGGHIMAITWIYVFTLIVVLTFAIEIGQGASSTGAMEFADIVFGIGGFLSMFFVFSIIRVILKEIFKLFKQKS